MIRFFTLLFFLSLSTHLAFCQKYDLGINIGGAGYMGEMNSRNPLDFSRGGIGLTFRKNLNPDFSLKFALTQLLVHGDEANSSVAELRQQNLKFTSWITEASVQFEFNFFKFNPYDSHMSYSPYLFAGGGGLHFNPYTFYNGQKVYLSTIGTEGQFRNGTAASGSKAYPLYSFCIPVGFGFKAHLSRQFSLVMEYGYRFTFTDYLDDVGGLYALTTTNAAISKQADPKTSPLFDNLADRSGAKYTAGAQRGDSWLYDKYFYGSVGIIYTFHSLDCPSFRR